MNTVKSLLCSKDSDDKAYALNMCMLFKAKNDEDAGKVAEEIKAKVAIALKGLDYAGCSCVEDCNIDDEDSETVH